MQNMTEQQERAHLDTVLDKLRITHIKLASSIEDYAKEIQETKEYIWQYRGDMDGGEKASNRMIAEQFISSGDQAVKQRRRIERLINSPYFGRIDFAQRNKDTGIRVDDIYIGVHSFTDPGTIDILIHDWRAPISSLFYDFEKGDAWYQAIAGEIKGEILEKRQYKIKNSRMEYMVESSLNIGDEVLQKELSNTTDEKMKNIVATIQREQNAVIRNETANTLILQGVAGSGKTSIALHRVAFLLYRFKDSLTSDNIMILSPNKVFADYISNVLPELGEEQIAEIGFEQIAQRILGKMYSFQSFSDQVDYLLQESSDLYIERIRYKATTEFVHQLDAFIEHAAATGFEPQDITVGSASMSASEIGERYRLLSSVPLFDRLDKVTNDSIYRLKNQIQANEGKWKSSDNARIKKQIRSMFRYSNQLDLYAAMYEELGKPQLFQIGKKNVLEYADVFPIVYLHLLTGKSALYDNIKHLLVDEMQDYTPIQYAVLRRLFPCKMTILGDSNQSVNPYSSSSLEEIQKVFPQADCVELCKSYRSTTEITDFAQKISRNRKLVPIERHGEKPQIRLCTNDNDQVAVITEFVSDFKTSEHHSLGIICKTQQRAKTLHQMLYEIHSDVTLLDFSSTSYTDGIIVTSAHVAKGLEFDAVIVPDTDEKNYNTELDKSMLYIACTRAMHRLTLTFCGEISRCLNENLYEKPLDSVLD